jgi:DNA (cytosine-5)-methyltransferase 1
MKYFSTFTGIGGFELGIGPEHECVGYSEVDKYAVQIYQKHFNHKNYGDITKINADTLPDFDFFCGGFPCQSFSIAGKRMGFSDTRGTLFFDIARILRAKRPRLFLLENVKGLLSHQDGKTFGIIIATLTELGYDLQWQVLNSKNHGVPQNRERIFIIGNLRGTPRPEVFPIGFDDGEIEDVQGANTNTLTARYSAAQGVGSYIAEDKQHAQTRVGTLRTHKSGRGFREKKDGLVPTIPARAREDGSGQPVILQKSPDWRAKGKLREFKNVAPTIRAKMGDNHPMVQIRETEDGFHAYRNDKKKSSIQGTHVTYPEGKSHALSTNHIPMTLYGNRIRRITPLEEERLQGFPDNWTDCVSDTQRYKTLGNAVTVNVIRNICIKLLKETH